MISAAKAVCRIMTKNKLTLALAESCTGGRVSSALTSVPGASAFYLGSVISYSDDAKRKLLGVSRKSLITEGAVSKSVAFQMVTGVKKRLKSQWGAAITGIAGPSGGTKLKPVGLVFIAVAGPKFVIVEKKYFSGTRNQIQQKTSHAALKLLLKHLKGGIHGPTVGRKRESA